MSEQRQSAVGLDGGLEKHRVQRSKGCAMEEAQGLARAELVKPGGASLVPRLPNAFETFIQNLGSTVK